MQGKNVSYVFIYIIVALSAVRTTHSFFPFFFVMIDTTNQYRFSNIEPYVSSVLLFVTSAPQLLLVLPLPPSSSSASNVFSLTWIELAPTLFFLFVLSNRHTLRALLYKHFEKKQTHCALITSFFRDQTKKNVMSCHNIWINCFAIEILQWHHFELEIPHIDQVIQFQDRTSTIATQIRIFSKHSNDDLSSPSSFDSSDKLQC